VCFAASQQNRDQAPFSICECMDLCVAPSARAANTLLLLPLFLRLPSDALLCASNRSSAYPWIVRSRQALGIGSPRCRAAPSEQSDYRSSSEDHTRAGNRTSGNRFLRHAPLITRRSSTRSTPRTSVGKWRSIRSHCTSLSQKRFLRMLPIPRKTNQVRMELELPCLSSKNNEF